MDMTTCTRGPVPYTMGPASLTWLMARLADLPTLSLAMLASRSRASLLQRCILVIAAGLIGHAQVTMERDATHLLSSSRMYCCVQTCALACKENFTLSLEQAVT